MKSVEERLESIELTQLTIVGDLKELKMGVCGSDQIGVEGLVTKVKKHEDYIESDKKQKWTLAGAASVVGSALAYLISKLF
jgi:hypothetical protein